MSSFVVKNNAESLVADNPLAQAAVTLNVTASEGANFPSTCPFLITLWDEVVYPDPSDDSGMEIVKCTARTTDALTIVRAQEGTADVAHALGERVGMLITAGIIDELIADVVEDTTPQLGGTLDTNSKQIRESKGIDVASATALTLGADGNYFDITGTTTITSIVTLGIGTIVTLHFDGALTLTHNATDLILPGGANITTAAGDEAMFVEYATGDWRCVSYTKASGEAVVGGGATLITKSIADIATDINGFSLAAVPAGMMDAWAASLNALIFNEAGLTAANSALIFNEAGFTVANKALVFNEAGLTAANSALIFNEAGLTAANSALIFNEAGLTAARSALIFNEAGLTAANSALIFNEAGLTAARSALIFNEAGLTAANSALIFNEAGLTAANSALIFNEAGLTVANGALIFNEAGFTVANKASVCNEATFTFANKALMFREAGLSIANINAIIIHANITDDNAQQILSEITKANRDLTSAANIYEILDDWGDNKLTGRDGAGATPTGFTNLFAHKGLFRPEWTTVAGTPTVTGGELILDVNEKVGFSTSFNIGTWEMDVTKVATSCDAIPFRFVASAANKYRFQYTNAGNLWLYDDVDSCAIINTAIGNDTAPHTFKITRDGSSNWEIFDGGISKGTVTDSTTTTFDELRIESASASTANYDNMKVY